VAFVTLCSDFFSHLSLSVVRDVMERDFGTEREGKRNVIGVGAAVNYRISLARK
jgi:hypothetical protein